MPDRLTPFVRTVALGISLSFEESFLAMLGEDRFDAALSGEDCKPGDPLGWAAMASSWSGFCRSSVKSILFGASAAGVDFYSRSTGGPRAEVGAEGTGLTGLLMSLTKGIFDSWGCAALVFCEACEGCRG